ncbi:MAG: hypothetical protein Q7J85_07105 [Bacillota bacterium]|nr:hypothetical protein [Bacillota bacterium]
MEISPAIRKIWEKDIPQKASKGISGIPSEIRKIWEEPKESRQEPKKPTMLDRIEIEQQKRESAYGDIGQAMAESIGGQLIKPEEPRIGGRSVMGSIFDVLSRGEYASANVAKDYILGKPFDMDSVIEGIKGEKKGTYDELSEAVFSEWSPWKRKAMGFAMAVMFDPTTYAPTGVLTVPFKAAMRLRPVEKGLRAIEKTPVGKAFVSGAGLPKPYYEAKYYAKKGLEAEEQRVFRQVEKLRSGLTKEDMEKMSYFRQHPDKLHELTPQLKAKLEKVGDMFDEFATKAEADGIITPEMANKWRGRDVPYIPGYYPARGIRLAKGDMPPSMFEKVRKPTFMKQKKFETLDDAVQLSNKFGQIANAKTIEEAKGLMKSLDLEDAFGKVSNLGIKDIRGYAKQLSDNYMPELNIVKSTAYRGIEQARFTARKQFIDNTLETFGIKIKAGTKIVPEGHGIYLPKGAIRMYSTEVLDPAFIKDFKGLADKLKDLRIKTEKVATIKKTTETTVTGVGKLAETGPLAKMEEVVRGALTNRGMTIPEANVYIGKLKAQGSDAVDDIIKEVNEKSETIRTILDSKALEGDLIDISKLTDLQKKQMVGITTRVPTYSLPKEIADDLNYASKIMGGDPATAKMFQLFDKTQNMWKGFATAVRLPFHLRNMYSNWWQAALSGVQNPYRFVQSAQIQKSFFTKTKGKIQLGENVYTFKELRDMANKLGIRGKGWLGADIDIKMFDEIDSMVKYGQFRKLTPMKLGRNFGTMIEDNSRLAVFIDQLAKGKSPHDASRTVRKYLFDYQELCFDSDTEILTNEGWKKWDEMEARLQVLSFNLEKDCLEWNDINYVHIQDFDGELNHWYSTRFDAMVTDKHKWVVYGDKAKHGNHNRIIRDKYSLVETVNAKNKLKVSSNQYATPEHKAIFSDVFVELIGWVLTEGNYSHQGKSIQIYQSVVNEDKIDRLRKCWENIQKKYQGTFSEYVFERKNNIHSFYIGKELAHKIIDMFPDKQLTVEFLIKLTNEQLGLLYEVMMITDGTKHCKSGHEVFTQKGDIFSGAFQVLAFLLGKRSRCRKSSRDGKVYNTISVYSSKDIYIDELKKEKIKYTGKIWCVNSDNKTVVARRRGTIYLSGNTDFERKVMKRVIPFYTWTRKNAPLQIQSLVEQPRKYQMYAKALRAFDEEETQEERMAKPEYFDKMMYVKSPFKSKLGKPLYMAIDLPPLEFNRVTDMHQWLSSSTPFKVIPEIIFNFKTFPEPGKLGKPLELARAPFWVGWLPEPVFTQMTKRGLIDKRMNISTGEYELGINKKLLHGIHTALPFLNEQSRIHAAPITLEDENPENKRKSYLSGVGFKTLDIPREIGRRASEADVRTGYIESFVSQRGRLPTMQELEELK